MHSTQHRTAEQVLSRPVSNPTRAWGMKQARLLASALLMSSSIGTASCFVVAPAGGGSVLLPYAWQTRTTKTCLLPSIPAQSSDDSRTRAISGRVRRQRDHRHHRLEAKKAKAGKSGRPSLDDVERLSRGQAAKKRGTGSRGVCHRLNESERKVHSKTQRNMPDLLCLMILQILQILE